MRNIVVVGCNHVNTLGLVRSLGRAGLCCDVILEACDLEFCVLRFSKYIDNFYMQAPAGNLVDFLIENYGDDPEKCVLLCASDNFAATIDRQFNRIRDRFVAFNGNALQGRICAFQDKSATFPIAKQCGLTTIKTWRVANLRNIPNDVVYPCIVKGNNSLRSHKGDMAICHDEKDLRAHLTAGSDILVQEYVEKEYEVDINGISINHGKDILIPGAVRKIRETLDRQSDYIVLEKIPEGLDVDAIKRFVEAIGYEGLFSVEFMKRGSEFYFLEINLRNDGVNYLYTLGGVNMPELWVKYANGSLKNFESVGKGLKTPIYLMQLFDVLNLKSGKVGIGEWMRDYLRARGHFVLSLRDPKPFLYLLWIYIRQLGRRVRRVCHI